MDLQKKWSALATKITFVIALSGVAKTVNAEEIKHLPKDQQAIVQTIQKNSPDRVRKALEQLRTLIDKAKKTNDELEKYKIYRQTYDLSIDLPFFSKNPTLRQIQNELDELFLQTTRIRIKETIVFIESSLKNKKLRAAKDGLVALILFVENAEHSKALDNNEIRYFQTEIARFEDTMQE